jgi:hypothetical protein
MLIRREKAGHRPLITSALPRGVVPSPLDGLVCFSRLRHGGCPNTWGSIRRVAKVVRNSREERAPVQYILASGLTIKALGNQDRGN